MPPVFRQSPPLDLILQMLSCYSLRSLYDSTWFSKITIDVSGLELLIPLLEPYYLPCKSKQYLYNINPLRSITILRQILKVYNFSLTSTEKTIGNKKSTLYQIKPTSTVLDISSNISSSLCVTFD